MCSDISLLILVCIFLMTYDMEHLFICSFVICIFFGDVSVLGFCPFLNCFVFVLLSFKRSLCILDSGPISGMSSTNIFS